MKSICAFGKLEPKHWACVDVYLWNLGPIFWHLELCHVYLEFGTNFWYLELAVYLEFGLSVTVDDEWELI